LALWWGPSPRGYASPSDPAGNETNSTGNSRNELSRLIEISTRLAGLNERLRTELADSRRNSAELSNMLGASKTELDTLRAELEALRLTSTGLLNKAELSNQELNGLREALRRAESSLTSLEQSFGAYRMTAESRIAHLERSGRVFKYGFIAAAVLGIGGWTAFALSR
jgi:chromosome segregation ATPase